MTSIRMWSLLNDVSVSQQLALLLIHLFLFQGHSKKALWCWKITSINWIELSLCSQMLNFQHLSPIHYRKIKACTKKTNNRKTKCTNKHIRKSTATFVHWSWLGLGSAALQFGKHHDNVAICVICWQLVERCPRARATQNLLVDGRS